MFALNSSLPEMFRALRSHDTSARYLTDACRERLEALDADMNAYKLALPEIAAQAAAARLGRSR